jgi:peptidoglycan/LPS O-acetylase OafA/YrhL
LAWALILLAVFSFVVAMNLTWGDTDNDGTWKVAGSATAVTGAFSQAATGTSRRRVTDTQGVRVLYLLSLGAVSLLALLIVTAIWEGIEDEGFYRFLGAVAVANLLLVLLQPVARRMGGASTASPSERARPGTHRLAFTLRGTPSTRPSRKLVRR